MARVLDDRLLWVLSGAIIAGAFLASQGFFGIDEAIYYLGARALAEQGTLGLDNTGYEHFRSSGLKLLALIPGPSGLTPQYPAGSAILAAPLLPILGPRSFILLNAAAAILALFTIRRICELCTSDKAIARVAIGLTVAGSYWLEYAWGIWPHMIAAYLVLQSLWFVLRYLNDQGSNERDLLLAGLFAGLGTLFRLDAILAVPAVGLILLMFARGIVRPCLLFAIGVLPSLAISAWLSYLKFGSPNPLSYGRTSGNVSLLAHIPLVLALIAGVGMLIAARTLDWQSHRKKVLVSAFVVVVAAMLLPPVQAVAGRFAEGFWALFMDMRTVEESRRGVIGGPGGTVIFWGIYKQALGQSLPWIGLAAMLLTTRLQRPDRRFFTALTIFVVVMTLPFVLLSWHGGGSANMRYFLPVVPVFAILAARAVVDLWRSVANPWVFVAAGVWIALIGGVAWSSLHPSGRPGIQQILSTYLLIATVAAAAAAGPVWRFQRASRAIALLLFTCDVMTSVHAAYSDIRATSTWRSMSYDASQTLRRLPDRSLVITHSEWTALYRPENGSIAAVPDPQTLKPDVELVLQAIDEGYRVYLAAPEFDWKRDGLPGIDANATHHRLPTGELIELRRATGTATVGKAQASPQ